MNSMINENMQIDTGYTFTSPKYGELPFNTLSTTIPSKIKDTSGNGPNIKCFPGEKFCGSADPKTKKVYCYGSAGGCKRYVNDCNTDSDCAKYNENSAKYTDSAYVASAICPNYEEGSWPSYFCKAQGIPIKNST